MRIKRFSWGTFGVLLLLFSGCEGSENSGLNDGFKPAKVLVTCEGNYAQGNASISLIATDGSVTNQVFRVANGAPLGDIAQSLTRTNGMLYAVMSNSSKIELIDPVSYQSKGSIVVDMNPQYLTPFNDSLALLSHLNADYLSVVNIQAQAKRQRVQLPGAATYNIGPMTKLNDCICLVKDDAVLSISWNDYPHLTVESISVQLLFNTQLCPDKHGLLWGVEFSTYPKQPGDSDWDLYSYATLVGIDLASGTITKRYQLPETYRINYYARALAVSPNGETLYLSVKEGTRDLIFSFDIDNESFSENPIVDLTESGIIYPYNMAVSPDGNLFVADAVDFMQSGWVYEFAPSGSLLYKSGVGIGPQFFLFSDVH